MIYTIGHSNHPIERFIALLRRHEITAVADVRSTPYSRFNPQFSREPLKRSLTDAAIHYVYLGEELGARSKDRACYDAGRVNFHKLAQTELHDAALARLRERLDLPAEDLFRSQAELIEAAYDLQAGSIAYVEPTTKP
jgi:uncharacterized protein (DUF488 family)